MSLSGPLIWLGILQAVIYLLFIRAIDLYEREPLRYVIPVFIWGFAVATTVSLVFNTLFQLTLSSVTSSRPQAFSPRWSRRPWWRSAPRGPLCS